MFSVSNFLLVDIGFALKLRRAIVRYVSCGKIGVRSVGFGDSGFFRSRMFESRWSIVRFGLLNRLLVESDMSRRQAFG